MKHAAIGPISICYPDKSESNEDLDREFPDWGVDLIFSKTGIANRYVAADDECSSDLAVKAAENLFAENGIDRSTIDYVLLCTQTPDYPLPTTSCLIQDRLGLRTDIGAFDFNLGCSGFVYGLSLAEGLIQSGAAKRILFLTAETYTKYIDPTDRSLRTIFSDAAVATLIESVDERSVSAFQFGTDGSGGDTLLVAKGGHRSERDALKPRHRHRWPSELYMDGPSLISFAVGAVPGVIDQILAKAEIDRDEIDLFLMHQATRKMLNLLQERLCLDDEKLPIRLENCGNTVSSTIPILIDDLRKEQKIKKGRNQIMIGFGVGWSWAGCVWRDVLCPNE
ncbi:MAG: ketoacyl-ACP synthase III [Planctomycetota bacterium]|nr:ketoacyl-ACP synthase III [Planctomycetota bacterium]